MCYQTLFSKKKTKKQKNCFLQERALTEFVLWILLRDLKRIGVWLRLQRAGDQVLEGQDYGRHSSLDGKQIQRKSVPSAVYMPMYHIVSADHFNSVLGQARNA